MSSNHIGPKLVLAFFGFIGFCIFAGLVVVIGVGSHVIDVHFQVDSWYDGSTTVSETNNATVITNFGDTHSSARILVNAMVEEENEFEERGSIVSIELRYPPPPEKFNEKEDNQVRDWIDFVEGVPNLSILIDLEGGRDSDGRYHAISNNVKISGWIVGIIICGLILLTVFCCIAVWIYRKWFKK